MRIVTNWRKIASTTKDPNEEQVVEFFTGLLLVVVWERVVPSSVDMIASTLSCLSEGRTETTYQDGSPYLPFSSYEWRVMLLVNEYQEASPLSLKSTSERTSSSSGNSTAGCSIGGFI